MQLTLPQLLALITSALLIQFYTRLSSKMQIANPASEYCIQQGGTLEIVKDKDGNEIGMCKLPDGTVIEEWELYRSQHDDENACPCE